MAAGPYRCPSDRSGVTPARRTQRAMSTRRRGGRRHRHPRPAGASGGHDGGGRSSHERRSVSGSGTPRSGRPASRADCPSPGPAGRCRWRWLGRARRLRRRGELGVSADAVLAVSTVIGVKDRGHQLDHRWRLTPDWRALSLDVERWGAGGAHTPDHRTDRRRLDG